MAVPKVPSASQQMADLDEVHTSQIDDRSLSADDLVAAYERGVDELRTAVDGLTPEQTRLRPIPSKWSTLEVVCHIADCEQFFADRMKRTLAMDRPLLVGADGSLYPEPLAYQQHDLNEELDLVAITRRQMARILRLAPPRSMATHRRPHRNRAGLVTTTAAARDQPPAASPEVRGREARGH